MLVSMSETLADVSVNTCNTCGC